MAKIDLARAMRRWNARESRPRRAILMAAARAAGSSEPRRALVAEVERTAWT